MLIVLAFQLLSNVIGVNADYGCLCIHGGTSDVYYQPFILSTMLGHLRDGDCKPTFQAGTSVNWTAIQFHNQVLQSICTLKASSHISESPSLLRKGGLICSLYCFVSVHG